MTKSSTSIEFSVRVVDGKDVKFESSVCNPLFMSDERQKLAVEAWFELIEAGLKFSRLIKEETKEDS